MFSRPYGEQSIAVAYRRFTRTKHAQIYTRRSTKLYRPVYTKGLVIRGQEQQQQRNDDAVRPAPPLFTRPFGWYANAFEEEGSEEGEEEEEME